MHDSRSDVGALAQSGAGAISNWVGSKAGQYFTRKRISADIEAASCTVLAEELDATDMEEEALESTLDEVAHPTSARQNKRERRVLRIRTKE